MWKFQNVQQLRWESFRRTLWWSFQGKGVLKVELVGSQSENILIFSFALSKYSETDESLFLFFSSLSLSGRFYTASSGEHEQKQPELGQLRSIFESNTSGCAESDTFIILISNIIANDWESQPTTSTNQHCRTAGEICTFWMKLRPLGSLDRWFLVIRHLSSDAETANWIEKSVNATAQCQRWWMKAEYVLKFNGKGYQSDAFHVLVTFVLSLPVISYALSSFLTPICFSFFSCLTATTRRAREEGQRVGSTRGWAPTQLIECKRATK